MYTHIIYAAKGGAAGSRFAHPAQNIPLDNENLYV